MYNHFIQPLTTKCKKCEWWKDSHNESGCSVPYPIMECPAYREKIERETKYERIIKAASGSASREELANVVCDLLGVGWHWSHVDVNKIGDISFWKQTNHSYESLQWTIKRVKSRWRIVSLHGYTYDSFNKPKG